MPVRLLKHLPYGRRAAVLVLSLLIGASWPAGSAPPPPTRPAPPPSPRLAITTTGALPEKVAADAAGPLPEQGSDFQSWARAAIERIVLTYKARDFPYARGWYRVGRDGTIRIHIDEGRVRVGFTGAGSVQGFLLRQSLNLPRGVVHEPTLRSALESIKRNYDLLNVYYRLREPGEMEITPFGETVPQRVLQIYVVSREDYGWHFDLGVSSIWGILPGVAYQRKLFWRGDRFRGKVELAFPFRQYLFQEAPSFQWVHGGLQFGYQTPRFWHRRLAPRLEDSTYVSHLDREDLQIRSYYRMRNTTLASLVLFLKPVEVSLGVGADVIRVFNVDLVPGTDPLALGVEENLSTRVLGRLKLRLEPSSEVMRRDQRHYAELRLDLASSNVQDAFFDGELTGQLFFLHGRSRFVIRPHAVLLAGDARFWDDVQLAGDWQRVWFDNRYWVRRAAQLELGYRVNIWSDWIDVGAFHDLSVFGDRTRPGNPVAVANAFGPSLHLLLFDTFALDVFLGFGFSPSGFNHGVSFGVQSTF